MKSSFDILHSIPVSATLFLVSADQLTPLESGKKSWLERSFFGTPGTQHRRASPSQLSKWEEQSISIAREGALYTNRKPHSKWGLSAPVRASSPLHQPQPSLCQATRDTFPPDPYEEMSVESPRIHQNRRESKSVRNFETVLEWEQTAVVSSKCPGTVKAAGTALRGVRWYQLGFLLLKATGQQVSQTTRFSKSLLL